MTALLSLDLISGPIVIMYVVAAILFIYLLARKPTRRWLITVLIGAAAGFFVAVVVIWIIQYVLNVFNTPLSLTTLAWVAVAFIGIGVAVVNLWSSRWWRKVIASVSIVIFLLTATLGINAGYGLTPTLGTFLHISTEKPVTLPPLNGKHVTAPSVPLWQSWDPPSDMPLRGKIGAVPIPNTHSHFAAREAVIYLPPAAQVSNPPDLPFIILLSGQPGDPNVSDIAPMLDQYAANNKGLAPIVLSADQLGNPANNPMCINSSAGQVETYMMQDVVPFARAEFNIFQDRTYWTIAGFSNGGECAISFGAKYPNVFGNILDVSGELEPDLGSPQKTIDEGFGGDVAQYNAEKPVNILAAHTYTDTVAIFATGSADEPYLSASKILAGAAEKSGMTVNLIINPGSGHDIVTVSNGYNKALAILYPRWGLSQPAS